MKTNWIKYICCLSLLCSMLASCSEKEEIIDSPPVGWLGARVAMTNRAGEDLVAKAMTFVDSHNDHVSIRFDSWETYLDEKLITSSSENIDLLYAHVGTTDSSDNEYNKIEGYKTMSVCGMALVEAILMEEEDIYSHPYVVKHRMTSKHFFGDEDVHELRIVLTFTPDGLKRNIQYDFQFDGKDIEAQWNGTGTPLIIIHVDE